MGQAKNRGTFEERKAAAIIINDEKQRLEAVAKAERKKHRMHTRNDPMVACQRPTISVLALGLMGGLCSHPK